MAEFYWSVSPVGVPLDISCHVEGKLSVFIDKLPIRRFDVIEEHCVETHHPGQWFFRSQFSWIPGSLCCKFEPRKLEFFYSSPRGPSLYHSCWRRTLQVLEKRGGDLYILHWLNDVEHFVWALFLVSVGQTFPLSYELLIFDFSMFHGSELPFESV